MQKQGLYMKQNQQQLPESEHPSLLLKKLCDFYDAHPEYETGIVDIAILMRLAHTEMNKFIRRPHKQVTEIFFDRDIPHSMRV